VYYIIAHPVRYKSNSLIGAKMNKQPCLDPLHAIETASVDELRALQLERMKNTMHHAYKNSPAYRAKFDDHGVSPDDLQSLEDLART
jgi:phenylacetate-CoA ligase